MGKGAGGGGGKGASPLAQMKQADLKKAAGAGGSAKFDPGRETPVPQVGERNAAGKKIAPGGGSGKQRVSNEQIAAAAAKAQMPVPGWTVGYWDNGNKYGGYQPAIVTAVNGQQCHLRVLGQDRDVPKLNIYFAGDSRLVTRPLLGKGGVWDWIPGFEKERLFGGAVTTQPVEEEQQEQVEQQEQQAEQAGGEAGGEAAGA